MRIHVKYCKRHGQDTRPFVTYGSRLNYMFKSKQNDEFRMDFRANKIKLWSRFIFFIFSLFAFKSKVNNFHMFDSCPLLFATNFTLMVSKLQSFKIEVFMRTDWFSTAFRLKLLPKCFHMLKFVEVHSLEREISSN